MSDKPRINEGGYTWLVEGEREDVKALAFLALSEKQATTPVVTIGMGRSTMIIESPNGSFPAQLIIPLVVLGEMLSRHNEPELVLYKPCPRCGRGLALQSTEPRAPEQGSWKCMRHHGGCGHEWDGTTGDKLPAARVRAIIDGLRYFMGAKEWPLGAMAKRSITKMLHSESILKREDSSYFLDNFGLDVWNKIKPPA